MWIYIWKLLKYIEPTSKYSTLETVEIQWIKIFSASGFNCCTWVSTLLKFMLNYMWNTLKIGSNTLKWNAIISTTPAAPDFSAESSIVGGRCIRSRFSCQWSQSSTMLARWSSSSDFIAFHCSTLHLGGRSCAKEQPTPSALGHYRSTSTRRSVDSRTQQCRISVWCSLCVLWSGYGICATPTMM